MPQSKYYFLLLIILACSPKTIPFDNQYNNNTDCECRSNELKNYPVASAIWHNYETQQSDGLYFDSISQQWQSLNEPPLGYYSKNEFRLTEIPAFGSGKTVRVFVKDSIATFMMRELDKDLVVINKQFRTQDYWHQFNEKLNSLFWKQPFNDGLPISVSDGSSYYFEGLTPNKKHAIYRPAGSEVETLLQQFYAPLMIYYKCKSAKKTRLNCG